MEQLPRFWLTAFWGFSPEHEGYYGFTLEGGRKRFLGEYQDGDLVIVYGADVANTTSIDRKQLLGILEVEPTPIWDTDKISESGMDEKKRLGKQDSWKFAVPVRRAWRIDQRLNVGSLLPDTYDGTNGQALASYGQLITEREAAKIVKLRVTPVSVFGETPVTVEPKRKIDFAEAYSVSRGPVPNFGRRSSNYQDGETYAYVMELEGDLSAFLGRQRFEIRKKKLIKVGISNDVERRLKELNFGFPTAAAIRWHMRIRSQPYPSGSSAYEAEKALHQIFAKAARPQGGEFFLCEERLIDSSFAKVAKAFRINAPRPKP